MGRIKAFLGSLDKKKLINTVWLSIIVFIGTFVMALGNIAFLLPYEIVPGGFTGFATIIHLLLGTSFGETSVVAKIFSIGNIALILNVPLFLIALKVKGKSFSALSVVGTIGYAISIDIWNAVLHSVSPDVFTEITGGDRLLAVVYGAALMGVGYGVVVRLGGSTGGSDMLATILNTYKPAMSFGTILLFVDGVSVLASSVFFAAFNDIAYGVLSGLYAFLVIFLSTRIADFVIEGKYSTRAYYIMSKNPQAISEVLVNNLRRGVTAIKSRGTFSNEEREMLLCVVRRGQAGLLKRLVFETDPHAFVFAVNAVEVMGEGFRAPELKKKRREGLLSKKVEETISTLKSYEESKLASPDSEKIAEHIVEQ